MEQKRLYVDMDGTLAVFNNQLESEEALYQEGYFRDLAPQQNVVDAVKLLMEKEPALEVFVLSAVLPTPYAEQEKNAWLDRYLPGIDSTHRLFVPCGEDKGKYIGHALNEHDLLLDDYSVNLRAWCPPGQAVKLMNGINGNFGTWKWDQVQHTDCPDKIASELLIRVDLREHIYYHFYENNRLVQSECGEPAAKSLLRELEYKGEHEGRVWHTYGKVEISLYADAPRTNFLGDFERFDEERRVGEGQEALSDYKTVSISELPGWKIVMFDDGSGHFVNPEGGEMYRYDEATNEYTDEEGKWKMGDGFGSVVGDIIERIGIRAIIAPNAIENEDEKQKLMRDEDFEL